jgi:hypothetical protein
LDKPLGWDDGEHDWQMAVWCEPARRRGRPGYAKRWPYWKQILFKVWEFGFLSVEFWEVLTVAVATSLIAQGTTLKVR